jgi:hypothetical protein
MIPYDQNNIMLTANCNNTHLTKEQAQEFLLRISPSKDLICPITLAIFRDPVIALGDGQTYERHAILTWIQSQRNGANIRSPVTNSYMEGEVMSLVANKTAADMARHYRERIGGDLCLYVQAISGSSSNLGDGGYRIRNFVEMGADLGVKGLHGNTAFMTLIQKTQTDLVEFILSYDLPLSIVNDEGLGCIDFIQREIRQGGSSQWSEILKEVEEKTKIELQKKQHQEETRDANNARQRERQSVLANEARNIAAMNRNGTVINGTLIQNGLGSLEEGCGFFPSLLALQFQGSIPPPSASFAEVEQREKKRLDRILKCVGGLVVIIWFLG